MNFSFVVFLIVRVYFLLNYNLSSVTVEKCHECLRST